MMKRCMMAAAWLLAVSAGAELEWKETSFSPEVSPTQVAVAVKYEFTNAGEEPITIADIQYGCGCLTAKLAQKTYAPGEKGVLEMTFNLSTYSGKQDRYINVVTSDKKITELEIHVKIPPSYTDPTTPLIWEEDETIGTKSILLTNSNTNSIKILSVKSSNKAFAAELKTVREGFEYKVNVTPTPSEKIQRTVLRVATEPPKGEKESRTILLYAIDK